MRKITILLLSVLAAFQVSFAQSDYQLDTLYSNTTINGNTGNNMRDMSYHDGKLVMLDKGNQKLCFYNASTGSLLLEESVTTGTGYSVEFTDSGAVGYTVGAYGMTGRFELRAYVGNSTTVEVANSGAGNSTLTLLGGSRLDYATCYGALETVGGYVAASTVNTSDKLLIWTGSNGVVTNVQAPYLFSNVRGGTFPSGSDNEFVDAQTLWMSGTNMKPLQVNLNYGDTTFTTTELSATTAAAAGGIEYFTLRGKNYLVVPMTTLGAFNIYDITAGADNAILVLSQNNALGSTANGAMHISVESNVSNDTATLYYFVPNNGLIAYKFYELVGPEFEVYNDTINVFTEGFEVSDGFTAGSTYNLAYQLLGTAPHQWGFYYGCVSTTDAIDGAMSAQMRWYKTTPSNIGYCQTAFSLDSISNVQFEAKNTNGLDVYVEYSTDGINFSGTQHYTLSTTAKEINCDINIDTLPSLYFRFGIGLPSSLPTATSRVYIDNVRFNKIVEKNRVYTPEITPETGTISDSTLVTMTCATSGAAIYYTLDGTDPTTSSTLYVNPFKVGPVDVTIKAIAIYEGATNSDIAEVVYNFVPATETIEPVFTPEGGNYQNEIYVTITSETEGARIYYTLDGTTPDTLTSTLYTDSILVDNSVTISAVAKATGLELSDVTTETYTLPVTMTVSDIAAFYAAVAADTTDSIDYFKITNTITVVDQIGSNLYVKDNSGWLLIYGSQDSTYANGDVFTWIKGSAALYQGNVQMTNSILPAATSGTIVTAVDKQLSNLTTADLYMYVKLSGVQYSSAVTYSTSSTTSGNVTDGSETIAVRNGLRVVSGSYHVGDNVDIEGFVYVYNGAVQIYPTSITLLPGDVETPVISPEGGLISSATTITITCATEGATIYYTTDGTTPDTTTSAIYSAPFQISTTTTVNAIATHSGMNVSALATETYTYSALDVATPEITPEGGNVTTSTQVTITCLTEGASIYYTIDGSTPDSATSTLYTGPFMVSQTMTVKAIAAKAGMNTSAVAEQTYVFPTVTEVSDIAGFYIAGAAGTESDIYRITGAVTAVYQNYRSLYVHDASGWLLIFGDFEADQTYTNGDLLQGVQGKYDSYQGYGELIDFEMPTATQGVAVSPVDKQISEIVVSDVYSYVRLTDVTFPAGATFSTSSTTNGVASQNGSEITVRNSFRVIDATYTSSDHVNIEGFISVYNNVAQLYPTSITSVVGVEENNLMPIYVSNGQVFVPANIGDQIEVYTTTGQLLMHVVADQSVMILNSLPQDQILLVRVANQTSKVVIKQ